MEVPQVVLDCDDSDVVDGSGTNILEADPNLHNVTSDSAIAISLGMKFQNKEHFIGLSTDYCVQEKYNLKKNKSRK